MYLSGYPLEIGQSARPLVAKAPRSGVAFAVNKQSTGVSNVMEMPLSLRPARWLSVQVKFEIDILLIYVHSRRFKKNQQIVDLVFYYPEFHTRDDLAIIRQNKR